MAEQGLAEIMSTMRGVRHYSAQPVPDALVKQVLELAIKAPSGSNLQPWRFIVVRDPETRKRVAQLYREALEIAYAEPGHEEVIARPGHDRIRRDVMHLAQTLHEVPPVQILVCQERMTFAQGPSIYPAVQNLMLAAWSFGLGTVLTTVIEHKTEAVRELLGIPREVRIAAFIPMGYPAKAYNPPKRQPVEEVTFYNRWGASPQGW